MNKILLILILVVLNSYELLSQERKFEIISTEKYVRNYNVNYLQDNSGNIVGTFEGYFYAEKPADLFVNYNQKRISIQKPLGQFIVVPQADRLFNYGVEPGFYFEYNLELHILKTDGSWIKNVGVIGHAPYAVTASADGDFYAFVHVDYDSIHSRPYLKKIDKNGTIEWSVEFSNGHPLNIYVSNDSKVIAVVFRTDDDQKFITEYYNQRGQKLGNLNHTTGIGGIEFIGENEFILIEGNKWSQFSISKTIKLMKTGTFTGNTFCNFPVTLSTDKDYFVIVSLSNDNKFLISAIGLKYGKIISEIKINESPYWEAYRMVVLKSKDSWELRTGSQIVKLQLSM